MKAIKREFLKPLDHTEDFKEKCREVIKYIEEAIAHADEECPYESESCITQAFMGIRQARQIVDTVSDYYDITTPYTGSASRAIAELCGNPTIAKEVDARLKEERRRKQHRVQQWLRGVQDNAHTTNT